ncbi:MAG TPA: hypothetical protein PJ986_15870 [Gammaproteobacteria bacterium]|nr:hypothetical protein [Gammaproteobacteria bacterium]
MQKKPELKSVAAALSAGFAVSLTAVSAARAADNPFAVTQFESGYMVAAEGGCGGDMGAEGGCGAASEETKADTAAEGGEKAAEGSCGGSKSAEGKCGN